MPDDDKLQSKWLAVIARALCYICLQHAKLEGKDVLERVEFLEKLGLDRAEAAHVAGSSAASVAVLRHLAKKREKMARRKRRRNVTKSAPMSAGVHLVRVLATWMIKDMEPEEAAVRLSGAA
jgi:hypothetical protein